MSKKTAKIKQSPDGYFDGNVEKTGWRSRWLAAIKENTAHPFNNGIHMDTHHVISAKSVEIAKMGPALVRKGYNINSINNLVGIPATLPAACHMKCQLHRSDHKFVNPITKMTYHQYVAKLLETKKKDIRKCDGKTKARQEDIPVHDIVDPLSVRILRHINNFKLPLTTIYKNFHRDSNIGCANQTGVDEANIDLSTYDPDEVNECDCKLGRNHVKRAVHSGVDLRSQHDPNKISKRTNKPSNPPRGNAKTITFTGEWTPKIGE